MLQQTQASRVADYYRQWLKRFPSFQTLARASTSDVLRQWSGLGYNSRALRFHQLAKLVSSGKKRALPSEPAELERLPGIGKYTAHAVACFALKQHLPVVDVNIRRIMTRLTRRVRSSREMLPEKKAWSAAKKLLPPRDAYTWNQSLMDLGALVCTARQPRCHACPVASLCRSAHAPCFAVKEKKIQKNEPQWKGIPRRLYRGTILKFLHGRDAAIAEIGSVLWGNAGARDLAWLEQVLAAMEREGFVRKKKNRYGVA